MKSVAQRVFEVSGFRLVRLPPDRVSGVSLSHDLAAIVDRPDPLCLDIGANEGQTIRLLQRTFKAPVIHAFEPSPDAFARLEARRFAGEVRLHKLAMGATCETREFATYADSDLSSFLSLDRPE